MIPKGLINKKCKSTSCILYISQNFKPIALYTPLSTSLVGHFCLLKIFFLLSDSL